LAVGVGSFAVMDHTKRSALARDNFSKGATMGGSKQDLSQLKFFSVTDQTELANEIAFYFKAKLGKLQVIKKNAEEKPTVNVFENVQSKEIYLICSFNPTQESIKQSIKGLVTSISTLKAQSPSKVNVVLPYYNVSRKTDNSEQTSPSSEELSQILERAGADKIVTVNMHENHKELPLHIPTIELNANRLCANYFKDQQLKDLVIVYTNEDLKDDVHKIQKKLEQEGRKAEIQMLRNTNDSSLEKSISGRDVLLVDNIVDSGKPLYNVSTYLNQLGARSINMFAVHGVINDETIDFLDYSPIKQLVITNTLPLDSSIMSPKISQVSVAKMLANMIAQSTFQKNLYQLHEEGMI